MREIILRGYAVEELVGDQWVYGTGVHTSEYTKEFAEEVGKPGETFIFTESGWIEVYPGSVGEFTGLSDKNANEIFEGDIVECEIGINKERYVGICEFNKRTAGFEFGKKRTSSYSRANMTVGRMKNKRVIGNIYENPELLGDSE